MTSPIALASANASTALGPAAPSQREQLADVAQQFEAIFLRQMLSTARETDFGGNDLFGGGDGEATFREMRDSQFADIASKTGAIGFASSIEAQLSRFVGPEE